MLSQFKAIQILRNLYILMCSNIPPYSETPQPDLKNHFNVQKYSPEYSETLQPDLKNHFNVQKYSPEYSETPPRVILHKLQL
jgi:hypothetical protein